MTGNGEDPAGGHQERTQILPSALVFDVNETLSDMAPLRPEIR